MKRITGHLTSKNLQWYAVLNLYDTNGKRSQKWVNLDLKDQRGTKTEANHRLAEILAQYNTGDLYLQEAMITFRPYSRPSGAKLQAMPHLLS